MFEDLSPVSDYTCRDLGVDKFTLQGHIHHQMMDANVQSFLEEQEVGSVCDGLLYSWTA